MKNVRLYILFLFMIFVSHELSAQKDTLIMNTGEILVGEIKGFDEGVLQIETDYSDKDFNVEWDKVVSINTERKFVLISSNGDRLFGQLVSQKDDPMVTDRNSAEAFFAAEYKIFNIGDLELSTSVIAYPGLTEKGRFRTDFDFSVEYEFEFDLFINLGFTLNYDNQPVEGATNNDYVLATGIGWEL